MLKKIEAEKELEEERKLNSIKRTEGKKKKKTPLELAREARAIRRIRYDYKQKYSKDYASAGSSIMTEDEESGNEPD